MFNRILKQIKSLLNKYIKKDILLFYFKKTTTIILPKLDKKIYFDFFVFKSIVLFNILEKVLELIILKYLCYIIEAHNALLNIQIKIKKIIFHLIIQGCN